MYPFNEIDIGLWALFVLTGLATVLLWGIISWTIVTVLRYVDARSRRGSPGPSRLGSDHISASDDLGVGPWQSNSTTKHSGTRKTNDRLRSAQGNRALEQVRMNRSAWRQWMALSLHHFLDGPNTPSAARQSMLATGAGRPPSRTASQMAR
jgi:hypothetical protein